MMDIKKEILQLIAEKGIPQPGEDYERYMPRMEMTLAMMHTDADKEAIETALEALCNDGSLVMDELNIYLYDQPAL